jgi:hypothetical protein
VTSFEALFKAATRSRWPSPLKSAVAIPKGVASRLMFAATLNAMEEQPSTANTAGVKAIPKAKAKIRRVNTTWARDFKN